MNNAEAVQTFSMEDDPWQGVFLTEKAARQVNKLMAQDPQVKGIRLGVKKSGCAGFAYDLELAREVEADELHYERDGAHLYVPKDAISLIDGTEVDYVREGLNQMFKFSNPKAQAACGCGESFGV